MRRLCGLGVVFALALTAVTGAAPIKPGDPPAWADPREGQTRNAGGPRDGIVFEIPLDSVPSWDWYQDPLNAVIHVDAAAATGQPSGTPVMVNGFGWDVVLTTNEGSWLSELCVIYGDTDGNDDAFFCPGADSAYSGTEPFSSGGIIKTDDLPFANFVLPDGILEIEFYEGYDDYVDEIDGYWYDGHLDIQIVPEPAALALLGLPLLRRKKR